MGRGHDRERLGRELLEAGLVPWAGGRHGTGTIVPFVARAAGSLGDADLIALFGHDDIGGSYSFLIEVKSDPVEVGPWKHFGPKDRAELSKAARLAGAEAWLLWIPPIPAGVRSVVGAWIPEWDWPS